MKKTLLALICVFGLTLGLFALPTGASGSTFFLGLNDTLPAQSVNTTPIQYNGWIYVPIGVFNPSNTGVNFGVYCGLTNNDTNLVFYNLSGKNMTFDLTNGTATAVGASNPVPSNILHRNGTYYAPAYAICQYFGLTYSYYTTEYGPLLRIKDGNAVLSDALFLSSTASMMKSRVDTGESSQQNGGTGTETPAAQQTAPPAQSTTPEAVQEDPKFSLSLGVLGAAWNNLTPLMDTLAAPKVDAVFFFPANEIWNCSNELRQAVGRGFRIGLIPNGETSKQRVESVKQGSVDVAQILHREVWFVYSDDPAMEEAGYLCWSPDTTLSTGRSGEELYNALLESLGKKKSAGNVLLDGTNLSGQILTQFVNRLKAAGDTFLPLRETSYSS